MSFCCNCIVVIVSEKSKPMALNFAASSSLVSMSYLRPLLGSLQFAASKHSRPLFKRPSYCRAQTQGVSDDSASTGSSARSQLDLLEQLTSTSSSNYGYENDGGSRKATIREQLYQLVEERDGEFTLPLGKKLKASVKTLTISQKRNIKRQDYLNVVSRRNDTAFFVTIALFLIVPPFLILSVAVLTGYVQLFP